MGTPLRVLIVEDYENDALLLMRKLQRGGYDLTAKRVDTAEALHAALNQEEWDIVISDFSMPGFSGVDALELLHTTDLDLPFIVVSGTIGEDVAVATMLAGAHDYIMKGNLARLVPAVKRELREAAERRARREAEEALRASEEKYRTLFDNASDAIFLVDPKNSNILDANRAAIRRFGYSREELLQLTDEDIIVPNTTSADTIIHESTISSSIVFEAVYQHKNGKEMPVEVSNRIIQHGGRDIAQNFVRDITKRKQAEEQIRKLNTELEQLVAERTKELEQKSAQLNAVLNSISEGVAAVIYDPEVAYDSSHRYVNPSLEQLTGYSADELELRLLRSETMTEEEFTEVIQTSRELAFQEGLYEWEGKLRRKNGTEFDAQLITTRITGFNGQIIGGVTVYRDVSKEKSLEAQKARFIADAAHDLRNPVTVLQLQLELIRLAPDTIDERLGAIAHQITRLDSLIGDLLMLSRLDQRVIGTEWERLDLFSLVAFVLDAQSSLAENKNITLQFEAEQDLPTIWANRLQVERVVVNLSDNALNYTPKGGKITVRLFRENDWLVLTIRDSGIGILPEDLTNIFERFYRAKNARTTSEGTGLGLAIVKEIIALHGAKIEVESEPGEGTLFRIHFNLLPI